jgi:hypothetical protein
MQCEQQGRLICRKGAGADAAKVRAFVETRVSGRCEPAQHDLWLADRGSRIWVFAEQITFYPPGVKVGAPGPRLTLGLYRTEMLPAKPT